MSVPASRGKRSHEPAGRLQTGDQMNRSQFHSLYEQMPPKFKAELIDGTVYVCEPLKRPHGAADLSFAAVLANYEANTPGVEAVTNVTVFLSERDEVQPDLHLRILASCGGQAQVTYDEYIQGAPELVVEIAHTSRAIDLGIKRQRYLESGVLEYIVFCTKPRELHWFELQKGRELAADPDGIIRSVVFPGLWIDASALLERNLKRVLDVLARGLATPEHQQFVTALSRPRK